MIATKLDRRLVTLIGKELEDAAKVIAEKYGVVAKKAGGSFTDCQYKSKIEFTIVSDEGVAKTPGRTHLELFFPKLVDLKVKLSNGDIGTIVEYHERKKKYPFIVKHAKGQYKLAAYQMKDIAGQSISTY